jgi:polynucleotide 5'-hydroxyl-kinase GRC3/NOL9
VLCRYGKVGYLDTDVGQPEFAPPGCLSFHVVEEAIAG